MLSYTIGNEYYIINESGQQSGPYELVALVVKVRNGSLTPDMRVQHGSLPEIKAAREWPELQDFFAAQPGKKEPYQKNARKLYLAEALKIGLNFLQHNQVAAVLSCCFLMAALLVTWGINIILPDDKQIAFYVIVLIFLYLLFSCYMFMILRMVRGQPVNFPYTLQKIGAVLFKLFLASGFIAFPIIVGLILFTNFQDQPLTMIIGLLIAIIPGLYTLTVYSYAPLLIIERNCGVWEAMSLSRGAVLKSGFNNFGVYFSLHAINFIAGLMLLFPMVIALPMTIGALTDCYDELFS